MKRVLIISSRSLFGQGIENLLRQQAGLEVVGREADVEDAVAHIRALRPDVILVDSSDPAGDPIAVVVRVLEEGVGARVIALNLRDNTLCAYSVEKWLITEVRDLIRAIGSPDLVNADGA